MLHRRLLHDDYRGVDEPLNETDVVRTVHRLAFTPINEGGRSLRTMAYRINNPPILLFADYTVPSFVFAFSFLLLSGSVFRETQTVGSALIMTPTCLYYRPFPRMFIFSICAPCRWPTRLLCVSITSTPLARTLFCPDLLKYYFFGSKLCPTLWSHAWLH